VSEKKLSPTLAGLLFRAVSKVKVVEAKAKDIMEDAVASEASAAPEADTLMDTEC
jgi:plasmid stability protein